MLVTQIEDLQLSLSRMEKESGRREDLLRQEISDLHQVTPWLSLTSDLHQVIPWLSLTSDLHQVTPWLSLTSDLHQVTRWLSLTSVHQVTGCA